MNLLFLFTKFTIAFSTSLGSLLFLFNCLRSSSIIPAYFICIYTPFFTPVVLPSNTSFYASFSKSSTPRYLVDLLLLILGYLTSSDTLPYGLLFYSSFNYTYFALTSSTFYFNSLSFYCVAGFVLFDDYFDYYEKVGDPFDSSLSDL
jgi:hypothetical protein